MTKSLYNAKSFDVNFARTRICNRLGLPPDLMALELTIATYMFGRESSRMNLDQIAELLGYQGNDQRARRQFVRRLLNKREALQSRANVRTCGVRRGEKNVRRVTQFYSNHLNDAALWIHSQIPGRQPMIEITDAIADQAIAQFLRRPLRSVQQTPAKDANLHVCKSRAEAASELNINLSWPLMLATAGFRIFPVDGKVPRVWRWQQAATTNESLIREWDCRWPGSAWGILCGLPLPDGGHLTVIDLDKHEGGKFGNGFTTLSLREEDLGELPPTRTARTPNDGCHYFFRTTEPLPTTSGTIGPALDCKSQSGFVVAYENVNDLAIAEMPESWQGALNIRPADRKQISEGQRHDYLRGVAYAMAGQGERASEILNILRHRLAFNCEVGRRTIDDDELQSLARSAIAKVNRSQREERLTA
jgi:hypothetical protein